MKRLLTALLTLCLLTALMPRLLAQPSEIIDKVIGIVGAEYILLSELEEQYALAASEQADLPEDARCIFLDQLLTTRLLLNQSKLDSIEVGDDEVERQLEARISRILAYMNDDRQQFEDYYGQSVTQVKERFREDLRNQLLVERMRGQVVNSVTVTPSEVKRFFAEIPQDSLPYFNSEVEIGEIVYVPRANEGEVERTRTKLEEIRAEIVAGTLPFEEAAKKFSMDGSGQAGGDLGWAGRGRYVPEFEATAYNLEPGDMSEVIQTEFGFHVLRLDGRRGSSIRVS
ncbi:MAG: peptidylprolyl isomerase, partial [Saprospiraceae bacterium]